MFTPISRRQAFTTVAAMAGVSALSAAEPTLKGRLKQSICAWCFRKHWSVEEMCQVAKKVGCPSVEFVDVKDWPILKNYGLICAMANSHPIGNGMNNRKYQEMCIEKLRAAI